MFDFIQIFFARLPQKPETEFTKQGYLFLMEKSKLSKYLNPSVIHFFWQFSKKFDQPNKN